MSSGEFVTSWEAQQDKVLAERTVKAGDLGRELRLMAPDRGAFVKPLDVVAYGLGGGRNGFDARVDAGIAKVGVIVKRIGDFSSRIRAAVRPRFR